MKVHNRLLSALSREVYEKLAPHLKIVTLERGKILHFPGETIHDVYFPLDCLISITITMKDGSTAETGVIGNREMLGVNAFMGGRETTQTEYIMQIAGTALKTDAEVVLDLFDHNKEFRDLMLRYTQALIAQISQTTACNLASRFGTTLWTLATGIPMPDGIGRAVADAGVPWAYAGRAPCRCYPKPLKSSKKRVSSTTTGGASKLEINRD